jgi:hypothetical protein
MHNIGAQVKVKWIGLFGLITLLALSLVFYRERISFLDSSYHLFFLLKDGTFAIQNFRFVAIFTQSIPLLLSYLHLPLNAIAIGYSASYVLLQIAIFWIIYCFAFFSQPKLSSGYNQNCHKGLFSFSY